MISVEEAKKSIKKYSSNFKIKKMSLLDARNLILAEDIISEIDIPFYPQSSMDGYAIRFDDRNEKLEIIGEMPAGTTHSLSLKPKQAVRVFTGAPLPMHADTVVIQEKCSVSKNILEFSDPQITFGQFVRPQGSDATKGQVVMTKNTLMSPAALAYLAGIGKTEISVFAPPKITILLTGDELQTPGKPLEFGQVYESNSYSLRAALENLSVSSVQIKMVKDQLETLSQNINDALETADILILCGGVSVGDYDFVIKAAALAQVETIFHKIKQKPGKPLFFGKKGEKLIFGLPGNPSSALTCFYEYVSPAICDFMQKKDPLQIIQALSTHKYSKNKGLTHFIKAFYQNGKVTPLHAQESYRMHSFSQSNCLIVLPENEEEVKENHPVEVHLLPI